MISYDEAQQIIRQAGDNHRLGTETVTLEEIDGRICAENVTAPMANQPFDNSAMDGYALQADELTHAANDNPVVLQIIGRIAAGDVASAQAPAAGQCYEIMTGAAMPPGCDAVVPVENVERLDGKVLFWLPAKKADNIRYAGSDFTLGESVVSRGTRLALQHVMPLATLGIGRVKVLRKPRVGLLSTGLEVIDNLDQPLAEGQIYNSSGPYLRQLLPALGAETVCYGTVADEPETFRQKLSCMVDDGVDIIVTTGAVSAGVYDFIKKVLDDAGAELLFHKVRMRPGKPILFAKLPNDGPLIVGLPGNPVATAAGCRFFVYPLMRAMLGLAPERPKQGVLKRGACHKKADFRVLLRAVSRQPDSSGREIDLLKKQQSFMVSAFIEANGWAVAAEGVEALNEGDVLGFYPFLPD